MKKIILLMPILGLVACSTNAPKVGVENVGKEVVVSTMDSKSRPDWVLKAADTSLYHEDGDIVANGFATLAEGGRIDSGFTICELNAKANLSKSLLSKVEHYAQTASEGTDFGGVDLRSLTSEASKTSLSGARVAKKFYERVAVTGSDGTPKVETRFYSQVRLSEADYQKALLNAAKREKDPALSQAFAKQVNSHFEQILGVPTPADESTRKPTGQDE